MNSKKIIRIILIIIWVILFINLLFKVFWDRTEIPYVNIGTSVVFYEKADEDSIITDIDATDKHIFIAYTNDIVSAYDWNGEFKFSIALYKENHALINIRCIDDKLYILDDRENVFIYEGPKLIDTILRDQSQYELSWFNKTSGLVEEQDDHLVDQNGNFVMDLPGQGQKDQNQKLIIIMGMILISGAILIIRRTKHK